MTPYDFIIRWRASKLKECSESSEHFIDLYRLLGEPTPAEPTLPGETFCFARGARKDTGGDGWADVWSRRHMPRSTREAPARGPRRGVLGSSHRTPTG